MTRAEADDTRSTAADLAAAALLGALLWDPRRVRDVADWLEPSDFRRWGDRAIYQTLIGLLADGRPVNLLTLPEVLARGEYHDAHVDRSGIGPLSAPALHNLISMTPATPRAEEHQGRARSEHVRYARIVLDDSIRRQVQAAGTRIDQYARHVSGQDSETAAEVLAPVLAEVAARLHQLTGRVGRTESVRSAIAAALNPTPWATGVVAGPVPAEVVMSAERPPPSAAQLRRAEYALIGACLVSAETRRLVEDRLVAADFTAPEIAATWQAIRALQRREEPIDFVLVAVEVEQQGNLPDLGPGLEPDQLARLARRSDLVSGYRALETVVHAALTRAVRYAHNRLQGLAGDRARSSENVLRTAQETMAGVEATARRLTSSAPRRAI